MAFIMKYQKSGFNYGNSPMKQDLKISNVDLKKYSDLNKKLGVDVDTRGTIDNPQHIKNARAMALSNPLGSIVEGVRVIGGKIFGAKDKA